MQGFQLSACLVSVKLLLILVIFISAITIIIEHVASPVTVFKFQNILLYTLLMWY